MKTIVHFIGKIIDFIEKICMTGSVISVIVMMLLVTTDVTGRKLFNSPLTGTVEITEDFLMVSLVFLAMSYVYVQGGHVRVTLFRRFIPEKVKVPVDVCLNILSLVFFALITFTGWNTTLRAIRLQEFSSSLLAYPLAPAYFIMTLGSAMLCVRIFETIISPSKIKWEEEH